MHRVARSESGIALPIAIFGLVVVGALVAGAFFAGGQEQRLAENARRVTQSFGVAEVGLAEQVRQWDPVAYNQQAVYPSDSASVGLVAAPHGTGSYGGYVYKLNDNLFLTDIVGNDAATGTGRLRGSGARQRLGLLTRIRPLDIDIQASLTTQGNVDVRGNSEVNGNDKTPTDWLACDPPGTALAAVRTGQSGNVQSSGQGAVVGTVLRDPTLTASTFTQYDDVSFEDLVRRAQVELPGGTYRVEPTSSGARCNRDNLTNWGDGQVPTGPCGRYFPIIYIDGDLTVNGVQGQGILLVRGNLHVQGSFEFFGIAIALGEFSTAGGGTATAHFWGGVMAQNASLDTQSITGHATLNYSRCAIDRALQATGTTAPLRSRGWVALY